MAGVLRNPGSGGSAKGRGGSGSGPSLTTTPPGSGTGNSGYKAKPGDPSWASKANPVALAAGRVMVGNIPGMKWSATGESSPWVKRVTGIFNNLAGGPPGPPTTPTKPDSPALNDPGGPGNIHVPGYRPPPVTTTPTRPITAPHKGDEGGGFVKDPQTGAGPTRPMGAPSVGRMGFGTNPAGRVASFRSGTGVVRPTMNVRSF